MTLHDLPLLKLKVLQVHGSIEIVVEEDSVPIGLFAAIEAVCNSNVGHDSLSLVARYWQSVRNIPRRPTSRRLEPGRDARRAGPASRADPRIPADFPMKLSRPTEGCQLHEKPGTLTARC